MCFVINHQNSLTALYHFQAHAALRGAEGGVLRRAMARAVEEFLRTRPAAEDAMSATSEPPPAAEDDDASSDKSDDGTASPFEMGDVLSDMGGQLELALRRWQRTAVRASVRSGSTPPLAEHKQGQQGPWPPLDF